MSKANGVERDGFELVEIVEMILHRIKHRLDDTLGVEISVWVEECLSGYHVTVTELS